MSASNRKLKQQLTRALAAPPQSRTAAVPVLAINMNFIAFSHYLGDVAGQVFVFFILTVAASETAIGLGILVILFRKIHSVRADDMDSLKG